MSPRLIIGCPVYKRDWILDYWFERIENQTFPLEDIGFVFELGYFDDETHDKLFDWHARHPEVQVFDASVDDDVLHHHHPEGHRSWSHDKYRMMVKFRNSLLQKVRCHSPEKYFSLDSDILLENKNTIQILFDLCDREDIDAVCPLMYMTPRDQDYPSVMTWTGEGFRARRVPEKYRIGSLFQADIIMAAKMMSKPVYDNVGYDFHSQGEDLGWSLQCKQLNYKLWCSSDIYAPHIMSRQMLSEYLINGDNRFP
jgi:hypothetical protein